MRKWSVIAFCAFAVSMTALGAITKSYHLNQLISFEIGYALFRMVLAAGLAAYFFLPRVRTPFAKKLLRISGFGVLSFGVTTLISPTFMGSFLNYVPLGDVFLSIEAGVLALLMSIELPADQPSLLPATWRAQLEAQPQKLLQSGTHSKAKAA